MVHQYRFLGRKLYALFFVTLSITASSSFAAPLEWEVAGAIELDSNAVHRTYGSEDETPVFRLELPAPGLATVDLVTAGPDRVPAKIELRPAAGATILEQSATHLVLAVREPGTFYLRAAAEDPHLPLGRYKLMTSFVEARVVDESFALAPRVHVTRTSFHAAAATKGEPEDFDPDPNSQTLVRDGRLLASVTALRFSPPAEKGDPEDFDPDPNSTVYGGPDRGVADRVLSYEATCRRTSGHEIDDHGDTSACATPLALGGSAAGEIGNAHGDDGDVFELSLTELTTVELATTGDTDTFGVLCDRLGQRLALDDDGAVGRNFRIVTTLAPGRYFVRVESGGGAGGAYDLSVRTPGG